MEVRSAWRSASRGVICLAVLWAGCGGKGDSGPASEPAAAAGTAAAFSAADCETPKAKRLLAISIHLENAERDANMGLVVHCSKLALEKYNAQAAVRARSAPRKAAPPLEQTINFESPHVHPLELTPDGNTLLAVNTFGHSLEVFSVSGNTLTFVRSIPVGLDPVSVRARSNTQAWVVNHVADTVSIVDLTRGAVINTIDTDNEPTDVVFAGTPQRAFVTASKANKVNVFDAANPGGVARQTVAIQGLNPRALAVSTNGQTVYAAIFESGNGTRAVNVAGTDSTTIVRDNVLADNDVAMINAGTLAVTYQKKLMTMVMGLAVNPLTNDVTVVGTELTNDVVGEPALNGIFVRSQFARFTPGSASAVRDLNPHLNYSVRTATAAVRAQSIADPRAIAWRSNGSQAFVTGMGSNNVALFDSAGARLGQFDVGNGPTGIKLKDSANLGYVLNRFDASISVIDLNARRQLSTTPFFDPTPAAVKNGRRFLYDARLTSGLGQASCASCHVDGKTDRLAWDLSDPNAPIVQVPVNNLGGADLGNFSLTGVKGPMVTQTLIDIMGFPRFHWRGDRPTIDTFNPAFVALLGGERQLSTAEMADFKTYLSTIWMQPNPYRRIDDSRPNSVVLPDGRTVTTPNMSALRGGCLFCHSGQGNATRNFGADAEIGSNVVAPALPGLYNKLGSEQGLSGFGFFHNGTTDVNQAARIPTTGEANTAFLAEILTLEGPSGGLIGAEERQVPHAGIGKGLTISGNPTATQSALLTQIQTIAQNSPFAALVARLTLNGVSRGLVYLGNGAYRIDSASAAQWTQTQLLQQAAAGNPVTFMLVVKGTETRIALDRNLNGVFDFDETTQGGGGTGSATDTVTDNFNRANGALGGNWVGNLTQFSISNNQAVPSGTNSFAYLPTVLAADQQAAMRVTNVGAGTGWTSLILKAEVANFGEGVSILVAARPSTNSATLWTNDRQIGWSLRKEVPLTLVNGDTLGARFTSSTGVLEVLRNGSSAGTVSLAGWVGQFAKGMAGVYVANNPGMTLDDFSASSIGGATTAGGTCLADNFNRASGVLGGNWVGNTTQFSIGNNQAVPTSNSSWAYLPTVLEADQQASMRVTNVGAGTGWTSLILKAEVANFGDGVSILVAARPSTNSVTLWTNDRQIGWSLRREVPLTLVNGDTLGARFTSATGVLEVLRNGQSAGTVSLAGWVGQFAKGMAGVYVANNPGMTFDDFAAGNRGCAAGGQ